MKNTVNRNLFIAIILALLLFASSCSGNEPPAASETFLTYENADYKIKIDYPSDWAKTEDTEAVIAFLSPKSGSSDDFRENINLVMNDLSGQELTLDSYSQVVLEQLKYAFTDMEVLESGYTTLSKNPAYKVVYTKSNLKVMQVWAIRNDISYILTYTAREDTYSNYLSSIQKMIDSFAITGDIRAQPEAQSEAQTEDKKAEIAEDEEEKATSSPVVSSPFAGSWRVYSERIFYDIGGAGALGISVTRNLELFGDGKWKFGDSAGTWSVTEISSGDWSRWGVDSYGPTRKMTLDGWNNAIADGPIEETSGRIDFIWVIYHVEPPLVQNAGTVWIKFGKG